MKRNYSPDFMKCSVRSFKYEKGFFFFFFSICGTNFKMISFRNHILKVESTSKYRCKDVM